MPSRRADVTVVIPNRDGAHWLEGCLASLAACTPQAAEVIVCDDGSADASRQVCARWGARWLTSPGPPGRGFASTINRGVAAAERRWVFVLNNDTTLDPECIGALVAAGERTGASVVAPVVVSLRNPRILDSAGLGLWRDGAARPHLHGAPRTHAPTHARWLMMPSGAAFLVRADAWRRLGPMDATLGAYLEDADWALRLNRAGGRILLEPAAVVHHWFSGSSAALSTYKARMVERNHIVIATRYLPAVQVALLPATTCARWLAMRGLRHHDGAPEAPRTLVRAALAGAIAGARATPAALVSRHRLQRQWPVDRRAWHRALRANRVRRHAFRTFGAPTARPDGR